MSIIGKLKRATLSGMQSKPFTGYYVGHHAHTGSLLIVTTKGVVKATWFRCLPPADRWGGPGWDSLNKGPPWDAEGAAAPRAPAALPPGIIALQAAPRRRYVTRANLRRYGVTAGCCACADIAAHGNSRRPHPDECRSRIEEFLQNDEAGMERLHAHRRRHDEAPEAPENDADVAGEDPAGGVEPEPGAPGERRDAAANARRPGTSRSAEDGPEDEHRRGVRARVQRGKRPPQERPAEPVAKARLEPRRG